MSSPGRQSVGHPVEVGAQAALGDITPTGTRVAGANRPRGWISHGA